MRWLAVIAVIAVSGLAVACTFDPGGTSRDDDGAGVTDASAVDGSNLGPIDAAPSLPIDATPPLAIDAGPGDTSCALPSDCPGQVCCSYAGGLDTSCADTCLGGDQVCEDISDCDGNDRCCDRWSGPNTCGFCF